LNDLETLIQEHTSGGLADLIYAAYCAGYSDATGDTPPEVASSITVALLLLARRRWLFEHTAEHVAAIGEAPAWLKELAE